MRSTLVDMDDHDGRLIAELKESIVSVRSAHTEEDKVQQR